MGKVDCFLVEGDEAFVVEAILVQGDEVWVKLIVEGGLV